MGYVTGSNPGPAPAPAQLRTVAGYWREAANDLRQASTGVRGTVNSLSGRWEGSASDSFRQGMTPFDDAGFSLEDALRQAAHDLEGLAAELERKGAGNVEALMGQSASRITGHLSAMSPRFSELAAPDGSRYVDTHQPESDDGSPGRMHALRTAGQADSSHGATDGSATPAGVVYHSDQTSVGSGAGSGKPVAKHAKRGKVGAGLAALGLAAAGVVGATHHSDSAHQSDPSRQPGSPRQADTAPPGSLSLFTADQVLIGITKNSTPGNKVDSEPHINTMTRAKNVNVYQVAKGVYAYNSSLAVDDDGSDSDSDPDHQGETTFQDSDGKQLAAHHVPFYVLGDDCYDKKSPCPHFFYKEHGIQGRQFALMFAKNKVIGAIFGDTQTANGQTTSDNDSRELGEASVQAASLLGINSSSTSGGVDNGVTVVIFSGPSWVVNGSNANLNANAQGMVQKALNTLGRGMGLQ